VKICKNDPFAVLLIDRLKLSPLGAAVLVLLVNWGGEGLMAYIDGTHTVPGFSVRETLLTASDQVIRIDKANAGLLRHLDKLIPGAAGGKTPTGTIDVERIRKNERERLKRIDEKGLLEIYAAFVWEKADAMPREELVKALLDRRRRIDSGAGRSAGGEPLPERLDRFLYDESLPKLRSRYVDYKIEDAEKRMREAENHEKEEAQKKESRKAVIVDEMYGYALVGLFYLHDWAGYIMRVFFFPVVIGLMVLYYRTVPKMYESLFGAGIIQGKSDAEAPRKFVRYMERLYNRRLDVTLSLVAVVIFLMYNAVNFYENNRYEFLDPRWNSWAFYYHFLLGNGVILGWMVVNLYWKGIITIYGLHKMFRACQGGVRLRGGIAVELELKPDASNRDGFAGLGALGRVGSRMNWIVFATGIAIALFTRGRDASPPYVHPGGRRPPHDQSISVPDRGTGLVSRAFVRGQPRDEIREGRDFEGSGRRHPGQVRILPESLRRGSRRLPSGPASGHAASLL